MAEHRWVGVDESMPAMRLIKTEDGCEYLESDYVLVWDGCKFDVAQAVFEAKGLSWIDQYAGTVEAVYWMPLPTPPEK